MGSVTNEAWFWRGFGRDIVVDVCIVIWGEMVELSMSKVHGGLPGLVTHVAGIISTP